MAGLGALRERSAGGEGRGQVAYHRASGTSRDRYPRVGADLLGGAGADHGGGDRRVAQDVVQGGGGERDAVARADVGDAAGAGQEAWRGRGVVVAGASAGSARMPLLNTPAARTATPRCRHRGNSESAAEASSSV